MEGPATVAAIEQRDCLATKIVPFLLESPQELCFCKFLEKGYHIYCLYFRTNLYPVS